MSSYYSYSLKFILDERTVKDNGLRPLYVRLNINQAKAEIALHELIDPKRFDKKTGRIIKGNRFDNYLIAKMDRIANELNQIRWELEQQGKPVTAKAIKYIFQHGHSKESVKLLDFFDSQVQDMVGRADHADNTMKHYSVCRDKLCTYLNTINAADIGIGEFSLKHVDGFYKFMCQTVQVNTVINNCRKLRAILNAAIRSELIDVNPYSRFRMTSEKTNRTALTTDEIDAIAKHPLAGNQALINIRSAFLFSTYTGLRYQDAKNLTMDKIKSEGDRMWLEITQEKTNRLVQIPLMKQAMEIIAQMEPYREGSNKVLPLMPSNQRLNDHLKTIAKLVGIKNKILSFHVARHSNACMLLEHGSEMKVVSELLGHQSIKSTEVYAKSSRKLLLKTVEKVEEELFKYGSRK